MSGSFIHGHVHVLEPGPQGAQGEQGPVGPEGPQGPAGEITVTPTTPARSLDSTFTPHASRPTVVVYTVEIAATASLTGGTSGIVELRSDSSATPTTVRCSARSAYTITLGTGIGWTHVIRQVLTHVVPAGHTCRLVTSGTATMTIAHQTEITL